MRASLLLLSGQGARHQLRRHNGLAGVGLVRYAEREAPAEHLKVEVGAGSSGAGGGAEVCRIRMMGYMRCGGPRGGLRASHHYRKHRGSG